MAIPAIAFKLKADYGAMLPQRLMCLGNRSVQLSRPTLTLTMQVKTAADMADFTRWWVFDLVEGTAEFTLDTTLFGVTSTWTVRIVGDYSEKRGVGDTRRITLNLELLDDIYAKMMYTGNILDYTLSDILVDGSGNNYIVNEA